MAVHGVIAENLLLKQQLIIHGILVGVGWAMLRWPMARTDTSEDAFQYQAWATGFISGAGWRNAAIEQTDYAAINYYLDDYCKRYPTNDLFMATKALISRLKIRNR